MKSGFFAALYQSSATIGFLLGNKRKFMNLGFLQSTNNLIARDEKDAHHIALYRKLIDLVPNIKQEVANFSALEMGCGRGGGSYVLKQYYRIPYITAVDLSSANIRIAKKLVPGVDFIVSDAVDFTTDKKFDIIINLESSHRYSSRSDFFQNVSSMLNSDGYFVFGDMIRKNELETIEQTLKKSGLKIIQVETANSGVTASIEKFSPKQYPLATAFPFLFPNRIHSFFVTIHSRAYNKLKNGDVLYNLYLLKKI